MARYKLLSQGVKDTVEGWVIPAHPSNRHWQVYQEWLAEGNTPDPEFTQADLDAQAKEQRQSARIRTLQQAVIDQFEMILTLFQVGKAKGIWTNTDFPAELRSKVAEWNQLISDYKAEV